MYPSHGRNWYCVPKTPIRYHSKAECMHPIAIVLDICVTNNGCKLCPIYKLIAWKKVFQVTTVSKSIVFLPLGVNYPHEAGNYPSFFCCTRSYTGLCKSHSSPAEDMTSSPPPCQYGCSVSCDLPLTVPATTNNNCRRCLSLSPTVTPYHHRWTPAVVMP
jgi:hypothetical protein